MKIVFATNNFNKISEIKSLIPKNINLLSLKDINCFETIEETGKTLKENAIIKADFITDKYNFDCFADDTGLEVSYLSGAPGVYSARYAGEQASSIENVQKLLIKLKNVKNRKAEFKTIIALNLTGNQYYFEGICKGKITEKEFGKFGFGYDSIFKPDGYDHTFAEMTLDQKGKISHRGKAVNKLINFLNKIAG